MKQLVLLLFSLFLFSQQNKPKGEVFKHCPERPYEDVKKTGKIIVKKGMYRLVFEDKNLSPEVRKKV